MRTGDIARAEHQRFTAKALKIRRFGAECYCCSRMTGQSFSNAHKFSVSSLFEGCTLGEQRSIVDLYLVQLGQRLKLVANGCPQHLDRKSVV